MHIPTCFHVSQFKDTFTIFWIPEANRLNWNCNEQCGQELNNAHVNLVTSYVKRSIDIHYHALRTHTSIEHGTKRYGEERALRVTLCRTALWCASHGDSKKWGRLTSTKRNCSDNEHSPVVHRSSIERWEMPQSGKNRAKKSRESTTLQRCPHQPFCFTKYDYFYLELIFPIQGEMWQIMTIQWSPLFSRPPGKCDESWRFIYLILHEGNRILNDAGWYHPEHQPPESWLTTIARPKLHRATHGQG